MVPSAQGSNSTNISRRYPGGSRHAQQSRTQPRGHAARAQGVLMMTQSGKGILNVHARNIAQNLKEHEAARDFLTFRDADGRTVGRCNAHSPRLLPSVNFVAL